MIFNWRKRTQQRVLSALADGEMHTIVGDLDAEPGLDTVQTHIALYDLEQAGKVDSGWASGPFPRRRVYWLKETSDAAIGAAPADES